MSSGSEHPSINMSSVSATGVTREEVVTRDEDAIDGGGEKRMLQVLLKMSGV